MEESAFYNKLRSAGNAAITILAPSDEAFQKIPASRLDSIMKDKEARLGNENFLCFGILFIGLYHVIIRNVNLISRASVNMVDAEAETTLQWTNKRKEIKPISAHSQYI